MSKRFDNLWNDFLEGELDECHFAELRTLVQADPSLSTIAADRYQVHKMLGYLHTESPGAVDAFVEDTVARLPATGEKFAASTIGRLLPPPTKPRPNWWAPAFAAAALAIFAFAQFRNSATATTSNIPTVARLILAEDCEWQPEFSHLEEGQSLGPGPLALKSGSAVVRFEGGAEVVITGDTRMDLISGNAGRLEHGNVIVRAEDGAEGFILDTPASEFIDLGTEFTVTVGSSGETKMQVHEGEVASDSNIITAGHAIEFKDAGSKVSRQTTADPDAPRFAEMLLRANPRERRDLMHAYEGFFVGEGTYPLEEMNDGKGWAGAWRLRQGVELRDYAPLESTGKMNIVFGSMNAPWPVRGGRLGALELPPGHHVLLRDIAEPCDLSKDGIMFFSFMVSDSNTAPPGDVQDLSLALRSSQNYYTGKLSFGWSHSRTPLIRSGGGRISRGTRAIPSEETVFCIAKIAFSADGTDTVQFRCYNSTDPLHFVEPAEWDVDGHSVDIDSSLDILEISSKSGSTVSIDEIRIGPTWRSVTPLDLGKILSE